MSTTRDQIIQAACTLLEKQGYPATGLNEIVRESGAPKGSLYYYFPDGKGRSSARLCLPGRSSWSACVMSWRNTIIDQSICEYLL
jgi:hypothetical protein